MYQVINNWVLAVAAKAGDVYIATINFLGSLIGK